jgi:DNA-binding LytR/AlgR family response regulator
MEELNIHGLILTQLSELSRDGRVLREQMKMLLGAAQPYFYNVEYRGHWYILRDSDIIYLEADKKCVHYHCKKNASLPDKITILKKKGQTMDDFEEQMNPIKFVRCSMGCIVNTDYLAFHDKQSHGNGGEFTLFDNRKVAYTKPYRDLLKERGIIH